MYQSGSGVGVFSTTQHVLLANTDAGRSTDMVVNFEKPFDSVPHVAVANAMLDMEAGAPKGYTTELVYVNEKGFKIRTSALTEKKIASIAYNWVATNDPDVHVEYVRTRDLGELSNNLADGARQHTISVPIVNWQGNYPTVASFLLGVEFGEDGSTLSFKQSVVEVNQKSVRLLMQSAAGSASVKHAKFCLVFSNQRYAFATEDLGAKARKNDPWVSDTFGERNVDLDFEIPSNLPPSRTLLQGLTGFDIAGEVRVVVNQMSQTDHHAHLTYGTWGDSKLQEIGYQAMFLSVEEDEQGEAPENVDDGEESEELEFSEEDTESSLSSEEGESSSSSSEESDGWLSQSTSEEEFGFGEGEDASLYELTSEGEQVA
jgi:hypothetical protein